MKRPRETSAWIRLAPALVVTAWLAAGVPLRIVVESRQPPQIRAVEMADAACAPAPRGAQPLPIAVAPEAAAPEAPSASSRAVTASVFSPRPWRDPAEHIGARGPPS